MGRRHARSLEESAEVDFVGVADRAETAGGPIDPDVPFMRDVEHLLDLGPEAIVIATPPSTQRDLAIQLADAGVHALIEKPLTGSSPEAAKVADRFSTTRLIAVVGYVERCNPAVIDLRKRIVQGDVGTLRALTTERIGPEPPGHGEVGVTVDLATHDIDLVMWIGGGPLEISGAEAVLNDGTGIDRHIEAVGRLAGGPVVTVRAGWHRGQRRRTLTAFGDEGVLEADLIAGSVKSWPAAGTAPATVAHDLADHDPLRTQLGEFSAAIGGEASGRLVTLDRAVEILEIAETAVWSATGDRKGHT
jgi:UDP-N-acetylglucosamine 3-dehydrogenase